MEETSDHVKIHSGSWAALVGVPEMPQGGPSPNLQQRKR